MENNLELEWLWFQDDFTILHRQVLASGCSNDPFLCSALAFTGLRDIDDLDLGIGKVILLSIHMGEKECSANSLKLALIFCYLFNAKA